MTKPRIHANVYLNDFGGQNISFAIVLESRNRAREIVFYPETIVASSNAVRIRRYGSEKDNSRSFPNPNVDRGIDAVDEAWQIGGYAHDESRDGSPVDAVGVSVDAVATGEHIFRYQGIKEGWTYPSG